MKFIFLLLVLGIIIGFSTLRTIIDVMWFFVSLSIIVIGIIAIMAGIDEKKEGKSCYSIIEGGAIFIMLGVISLIIFLSFC